MGKKYCHLQPKDRLKIYELLFEGESIPAIAHAIGYHKSTLYRELERNSSKVGYRPDFASQAYVVRRQYKPNKLDKNPALKTFLIEKLKMGWSPELIAGRLKQQSGRCLISHETIYRYIYSPAGIKLKLHQSLQKKRKFRYPRIKRRRQTIAKARKRSIKERGAYVDERGTFGHWEGDLILFRHTKTNLFTLRERKSRLMVAIKNPSRHAHSTANILVNYMKNNFVNPMKSLTLDNDTAFAQHENIEKEMKTQVYFCEPYKSYQKGSIENANCLLRTQLPLQTNIDSLEQDKIDNIVKSFNNRPMKCLGYQTPHEVFYEAFT
jgi:IS30 family transposase